MVARDSGVTHSASGAYVWTEAGCDIYMVVRLMVGTQGQDELRTHWQVRGPGFNVPSCGSSILLSPPSTHTALETSDRSQDKDMQVAASEATER